MDTEVVYATVEDFPDYYVTSRGEVVNSISNRTMTLSPTMNGDLTVGLMRNGYQYRRSVKVLVARAFVFGETPIFNTPIHLDGNKYNLNAENIVWRPRWFAWKYTIQFTGDYPSWYADGIVIDITANQRYHTIFEAAKTNGLLCQDIYESIQTNQPVFPTGQIFTIF